MQAPSTFPDEAARLQLLRSLDVLDTPPDPVLDSLVQCASQLTVCPVSLVTLIDADRQWFKARVGLDAEQTPRDIAFCAHAIASDGLMEVQDARLDARFADNPLVRGEPPLVFYAGVPLSVEGHQLGTLCVIDSVPRQLSTTQRGLLAGLARAAEHWLASRREQVALRESRAMLAKLSAQLPGFVYQFRQFPDGHFSFPFASEGIREIYELKLDEVREDASLVFGRLHPDDLPAVSEAIQRSAQWLTPWHQEYRVLLPRQGLCWREGTAQPERLPDGSVVWHGFITDITERRERDLAYRQVQQRWRIAVDAARLGLIEIDRAGGHVSLDAAAAEHHSLPGGPVQLRFDDWVACFMDTDQALLRTAADHAMQGGSTLRLQLRLQPDADDERERSIELSAQPADDEALRGRLIGTCSDISSQVAFEQLQRDKLAAERASRAKSEFLSRVSHELRTPLNAILGFTQLLQMDAQRTLDEVQGDRIERVRAAGSHLLELINDMLDVTRIEQGGRSLVCVVVPLAGLLNAASAMVEPQARQQQVHIEVEPVSAELAVLADPRALEQALLNLLSNGIKYNRRRGTLRLAARRVDDRVAIDVQDQGAGLSEGQIAELFQPFNRLGAEHGSVQGSGLGLVIARSLLEAMGGSLKVESTPGRGSTFCILLPWAAPLEAAKPLPGPRTAGAPTHDDVPSAVTAGSTASNAAGNRASILYIEDEPVNALLVTEALRAMPDWRIVVARDGAEGLAQALALKPDVLLCDMNLPTLSGAEVVRRLRQHPATRRMRCVAVSADALPQQIAAARAAGFDDYWTKPLHLPTMLAQLQRQIELSRGA
jgi:signal transduction histidine kinase/ActR/RegA family two-component response regulator